MVWEGDDRRHSPHEDCTAHSGMNSKLNINLLLGGLGLLLLSTLLALVIDTNAYVKTAAYRLDSIDRQIDDHGNRLLALERRRE